MTRSQFILAFTLLVVSGTIAFTVTFQQQDERVSQQIPSGKKTSPPSSPSKVSTRATDPRTLTSDRTHYEITVSELSQSEDAALIEREISVKLEQMSQRYELTGNQRRQIYPLLAQYHPSFQEGMLINGQNLSLPAKDAQLSNAIYPLLEGLQQESFVDDTLAENRWWEEIISQLRDDLDQAIGTGEMIPASDDGELSEDSGGGLQLNK